MNVTSPKKLISLARFRLVYSQQLPTMLGEIWRERSDNRSYCTAWTSNPESRVHSDTRLMYRVGPLFTHTIH